MPIHAAVFFRDKLEMTASLVHQLHGATMLHLFDNGSEEDITPLLQGAPSYTIYRRPGATLTQMWNMAWDAVLDAEAGPADLAILNNDITVSPGFLGELSRALRSDDRWWVVGPDTRPSPAGAPTGHTQSVQGIGVGGMAGWAFMLRAEARRLGLKPVDEQFEWWYGDNDVIMSVRASGYEVGLVEGVVCAHQISATWRDHPELHSQTMIDQQRYNAKWGA